MDTSLFTYNSKPSPSHHVPEENKTSKGYFYQTQTSLIKSLSPTSNFPPPLTHTLSKKKAETIQPLVQPPTRGDQVGIHHRIYEFTGPLLGYCYARDLQPPLDSWHKYRCPQYKYLKHCPQTELEAKNHPRTYRNYSCTAIRQQNSQGYTRNGKET